MTIVEPLVRVLQLGHRFAGSRADAAWALHEVSFELHAGEVMAVVGESGSGKSTLLNLIAGRLRPLEGQVFFRSDSGWIDVHTVPERQRRQLARTEWGFVEQSSADALRLDVSAGANIVERLMGQGCRHYGDLRRNANDWMQRVELELQRIDDTPRTFSGGMRQRVQIARNLVTEPRLLLMDEPTSGLDVSVQARLLDLLRALTRRMHVAALVVTHDLGVARLLAARTLVMRAGRVVESGLTDRVFDDPHHPYTQLLVSSVLA